VIFDCFTFFNELDLVELRFRVLADAVDYFVVSEAPFTFRGEPKPLYFREAAERFARWRERIILLTYPRPFDPDPWQNEWGQRNFLVSGLDGCRPDDLILIGDCDEFPDPRNVGRRPATRRIIGHQQRMSAGYFNRVRTEPWIGTRTIEYRNIGVYGTLNDVRLAPLAELELVEGGWHFTSIGGAAVMAAKMRAYSHSEFDVPYFRDERRLDTLYNSERDEHWIPFDESFPAVVREDPFWSRHVWAKPARAVAETAALEHAHGLLAYVPPDAARLIVVTDAPAPFAEAAAERFGDRFAGVAATLAPAVAGAGPGTWAILDGIGSDDTAALDRLCRSGAGVVLYLRNAGSLDHRRALRDGRAAGRAIAIEEFRAWLSARRLEYRSVDRIATEGTFVNFDQLPEMVNAEIDGFQLSGVTRAALADFLARAFIYTFVPIPARTNPPGEPMSEAVPMTIATVTLADLELPRWMTPFAQQMFAIPTHMSVNERLVLLQSALELPQGFTAVEIGSYLGASTAFLAFAALQRAGYVHAVDPWSNEAMGAEGERDTFAEFTRNTEPFKHYVVAHRGKSDEVFARSGAIPCDLLFVDGDHSYEAVCTDLRTWLPSLKPGGILAMHDIDHPPVKKAFDELVPAAQLTGAPQVVGRLLVARVRAPAPAA
jgi:predicted O-methyltransferase YrrM